MEPECSLFGLGLLLAWISCSDVDNAPLLISSTYCKILIRCECLVCIPIRMIASLGTFLEMPSLDSNLIGR